MRSEELRAAFVDFFVARGHKALPSASLVPDALSTTLFTIAGMEQFVPVFLGEAPAPARFAYNVTGGSYVTEAELAGMIGELLPGLSVAAGPPAWNEGHLGRLDIAAAERDLGYRPSVNLRDGLAALADHIKAVRAA